MTPEQRRGVAIWLRAAGSFAGALIGASSAAATPDDRCSNQISYTGDPRSNAEINSIDAAIGQCPAPVGGLSGFPV
jgi:hypothetical protein